MATHDKSLIFNELLKLKKEQLVEVIVYNKLTSEVPKSISTIVHKILSENQCQCNAKEEFSDACDVISGKIDMENAELKTELVILKNKHESDSKLIFHLEKRLLEQEELISLLHDKNKLEQHKSGNKPNTRSLQRNINEDRNLLKCQTSTEIYKNKETSTEINPKLTKSNELNKTQTSYKNVLTRNSDDKKQISTAGATKTFVNTGDVKNAIENAKLKLNISSRPITGTGVKEANVSIKTVPPQGHLSVYRCHPETTEEDLTAFLKQTASDIPFHCKKVKTNDYEAAFKVSFPLDYLQEVYNPEIWPEGAVVRRFLFQNSNFLRVNTRKNLT